jgi:hypothetical protein
MIQSDHFSSDLLDNHVDFIPVLHVEILWSLRFVEAFTVE